MPTNRWGSYGRDNWQFNKCDVEQHTDKELLEYCGYTPEFGGRVERNATKVLVMVYTD